MRVTSSKYFAIMKKKCENMLVVFPVRVYYVSVCYNVSKSTFWRVICSSTVEINLGDMAFHTLIFLYFK